MNIHLPYLILFAVMLIAEILDLEPAKTDGRIAHYLINHKMAGVGPNAILDDDSYMNQ